MEDITIKKLFSRKSRHVLAVPIHGVGLRFSCDQKMPLDSIKRYLRYFTGQPGRTWGRSTSCNISIVEGKEYKQYQKLYQAQKKFEAFPGVMATFGNSGHYSVYEIKSSCLIMIDDRSNDCACVLRRSEDKRIFHIDLIVHILLIEWLRGKGLFFIHSSGICRGRNAFLFIGPSGAGKTTSSLMGIQRGLSFLGDDLLIVKEKNEGITVHSYVEDVKFCLDMTGRFGELKTSKRIADAVRRRTKTMKFDVQKYFNAMIADSASVSRIFFLNRGNSLKKLKPQEALPLLMKNSFFYSRSDASVKHFEILCKLIYSVDSFVVGRSYINRHFERLVEERIS